MDEIMKRFTTLLCGLAILATAVPAWAQDTALPRNKAQANPQATQADRSAAGRLDSVTRGPIVRVSKLTGMNIQNQAGEGVGEINDLVLDVNTGKIRYAAVTYGGFLGIGNKMFAVPFEAFRFERDRDDANAVRLILDVTEQQLEGAVGFDEDNWPDFADEKFGLELDKRYKVERHRGDELGNPSRRTD